MKMDNIQTTNNTTTSVTGATSATDATSVTPTNIPIKPGRTFTTAEVVFAWICYIAGYLFCRVVPLSENPFGGFLFIIALFTATIVVLVIKKAKFSVLSWLAVASAIVMAASLVITTNDTLTLVSYLYSLVAYFYFVYSATGNTLKKGLSDMIVVDFINALFAFPFRSLEQMFKAMFSNNSNKSGKLISRSLLGLVIAFIPTVIVLALLSYDSEFWRLFKNIFDFNFSDVFSHLVSFVFAIPVGMYFYGLFVSSVDKNSRGAVTCESCSKSAAKMRFVPVATIIAAVTPLIFIYILFFISQWQYYISGFTGVLPAEFSYADYAREGFFQLCAVSIINLAIILAAVAFIRRDNDRPPVILKIIAIIFSVFTLILISTAIAKMVMYIDCYGLTQKRVYATWLMVVLAIVFLLVIVKQFVPKLNAVAVSLMVCVLLFSVLALSNADSIIVKYNVNRYLDGSLSKIDIQDMSELGDAAIPGLVHLAEELDKRNGTNIVESSNTINTTASRTDDEAVDNKIIYETLRTTLHSRAKQFKYNDRSLFEFNLPALRAKRELQRVGL